VHVAQTGASIAETHYDFWVEGHNASFHFDWDHSLSSESSSGGRLRGTMNFTVSDPVNYSFEGMNTKYGPQVNQLWATLKHCCTGSIAFHSYQEGHRNNSNQPVLKAYILGLLEGDEYNELEGSISGVLAPGDYELSVSGAVEGSLLHHWPGYGSGFLQFTMSPANTPPTADAGPNQTVEQDSYAGGSVILDGSASTDDGQIEPLTYIWTWADGSATGVSRTVILPLGTTTVTLTVYDGEFSDTDTVDITVQDTTEPAINSLVANPDVLWPPNHEMVEVNVEVDATDICDPNPFCFIVGVSSDEPINGLGDGNTEPDWQLTEDPLTVLLRAERSGTGAERVYTIHVECTDASGNTAAASVDVIVPHDQSKGQSKGNK